MFLNVRYFTYLEGLEKTNSFQVNLKRKKYRKKYTNQLIKTHQFVEQNPARGHNHFQRL